VEDLVSCRQERGKTFQELRAQLSPKARLAREAEHRWLVGKMNLHQLWKASESEQTKLKACTDEDVE
jgi:hypothetical protein